jgi:hypothetical protein
MRNLPPTVTVATDPIPDFRKKLAGYPKYIPGGSLAADQVAWVEREWKALFDSKLGPKAREVLAEYAAPSSPPAAPDQPEAPSPEPEPAAAAEPPKPAPGPNRKLRDVEPDPERLEQARHAEIAARYERSAPKADAPSMLKLRLAQGKRLLRRRLITRLSDDADGRAVADLLLRLGMVPAQVVAMVSWEFEEGYIDHVLACRGETGAAACGRIFKLRWLERIHPSVRAWNMVAVDETPEVRAQWSREQRRIRDGKRDRRQPPKPRAAVVDQLSPRALEVLKLVDREWVPIVFIVETLRETSGVFRKSSRSKHPPSINTMSRAVRRSVAELVRVKLCEAKEEALKGSARTKFVRVASPTIVTSNDAVIPLKRGA